MKREQMNRQFFRLLFILCIIPLCGLMHSDIESEIFSAEGVTVRYYDVHTNSVEDARKKMLQLGPIDDTNKPRYASVEWTIAWKWNKPVDQSSLKNFKVIPTIKVSLPRFIFADTIDAIERNKLMLLSEQIRKHENNHLKRVSLTVLNMREALATESRKSGATTMSMNKVAQKLISENNGWDAWYDLKTFHGRSEGIF
jgi:predicted secreted Zn-dependent protease